MRKLIITLLCLVCLSGCGLFKFYQPNIQQGNIITQGMLNQLQIGMSKTQVANALGLPVLDNMFNQDHWAYVYTFQHSGGKILKKQLDLYFQNDSLVKIINNYTPAA